MKSVIVDISNFNEIGESIYGQLFIFDVNNKDNYEGDVFKVTSNITEIKIPNKSSFETPWGDDSDILICLWSGDSNRLHMHNYLNNLLIKNNNNKISEYITTSLIEKSNIKVDIKKEYTIKINETLNEIQVTPQVMYSFRDKIIFPQRKYFVEELTENGVVPFDGFTGLQKGEYDLNIRLLFSDDTLTDGTNIKIKVIGEKEEQEFITLNQIKYQFAYFSPIYSNAVKPMMPIALYISKNLTPQSVDVFINTQKTETIRDFATPLKNINISTCNSYQNNEIKLVFNCLDEDGKQISFEDKKTIFVSENIDAALGVEYNSDTGVYTINLSSENETLQNITNILWRVIFDSYVIQNVVNIAGKDEHIKTDIVYEELAGNDAISIDVEMKQIGKYVVEAYLIDAGGNTKKLSTEITSVNASDNTEEYSIGDKISFSVISKSGAVPVYKLYAVKQDGTFEKIQVTGMNQLFDNIYGTEFTAELNDCVYVAKIDKAIKIFKVGDSKNIVIAYSPNYTENTTLNYVLKSVDGDELESGTATYGEEGLMYVILNPNNHGILKIGNSYKQV